MIVLMVVCGMIFTCLVFSYLFLWLVNPAAWPPAGTVLPDALPAWGAAVLYIAGAILVAVASRHLRGEDRRRPASVPLLLAAAVVLLAAAPAVDLWTHLRTGLSPSAHAYGASVYGVIAYQILFVGTCLIMGIYTIARWLAHRLDSVRRTTFDNTMLFWYYTTGQGVVGLLLVYGFPRLAGGL
jgi:cytochrome c oxidase subunit I+III